MNAAVLWLSSRRAFQAAMSSAPDAGRSLATPMPSALPPGIDQRQLQRAMRLAQASMPRGALFRAMSPTPYHLAAASVNSQNFDLYLRDVSAALASGLEKWARLSVLVDVTLDESLASGGKLVGPPFASLAMRDAPHASTQQQRYSQAIVGAIGEAFDRWSRTSRLPPIEPTNLTLARLESDEESSLTAEPLAESMKQRLADPRAYHQAVLFHAVASGFAQTFSAWTSATVVTNLLSPQGKASMRASGRLVAPPSAAGLVRHASVEEAMAIANVSGSPSSK